MSVPLSSLVSGNRINFTLNMSIYQQARYNNFAYQGRLGYEPAKNLTDLEALVASTKAYFRSGSPTTPAAIEYVLVKQNASAPLLVIPEPLILLDTLTLVSNITRVVTIRDDIETADLQALLAGNNLTDFTIVENQT